MKYSKILTYDACNCHGYSVTLWVCGCDKKCKDCFNQELWDYNYGKDFTDNTYNIIKEKLLQPHINCFVLLGGEPMSDKNRPDSIQLLTKIRKDFPNIEIIVYTGYTFESLDLKKNELEVIDYIIDGDFQKDKKVKMAELRGSYNQRAIKIDRNNYSYMEDKDYFKK